jgi:hypothetical protein
MVESHLLTTGLKSEYQNIGKKKITMDRLYDDVGVIWQDNGDSKHRSYYALERIDEIFDERVKPDEQADKMVDIWPIENVWAYIIEKLSLEEIENLPIFGEQSFHKCAQSWFNSIPRRLQCLINN